MVDRIRKTLRLISTKQRAQLLETIRRVKANDLVGLNVKKLHGLDDVYRVRKGEFRIIFCKVQNPENVIIGVERRSNTTYNEY